MIININLIPPKRKEEIKKHLLSIFIIKQEILFSFVFLVLIFVVVSLNYLMLSSLSFEAQSLDTLKQRSEIKELEGYEQSFRQANDFTDKFGKIRTLEYYHGDFLSRFAQLVPDSIKLKSLEVTENKASLLGWAKTREDLINFQSTLKAQDYLRNAEIPLSDLVKKEDIEFQAVFEIDEKFVKAL